MCVELAVNLCAQVARHYGVAPVVFDDLPPSRPMSEWTVYVGVCDLERVLGGQRVLPNRSLI